MFRLQIKYSNSKLIFMDVNEMPIPVYSIYHLVRNTHFELPIEYTYHNLGI